MHRTDALAILGNVAALCGAFAVAGVGDTIDTLAPGWGKKAVAVFSLTSLVAGNITRILANPKETS
jgi:hypothetical protein